MMWLNIRHQLPQTAIRHTSWDKWNVSASTPAEVHTEDRQARSNKGATQASVNIDSYPSRRAYGARNMTDFTRERGQAGLSGVKSGTSSHTQQAWSNIENGAKKGNDIPARAKNEMFSKYTARNRVDFQLMQGPTITANPSRVVGDTDTGDVTAEISTEPFARMDFTQGKVETYMEDQGFIRRWLSDGKYDIYA